MKTSIKTPFLTTLFLLGMFMLSTLHSAAQSSQRIRVVFGTRTHPTADGKGCEGEKGICFLIYVIKDRISTEPNSGVGEVVVEGQQLTLNIISDTSPAEYDEQFFHVYRDIAVPADAARALGYTSITIKKGRYPLNKSRNPLGQVTLPVVLK